MPTPGALDQHRQRQPRSQPRPLVTIAAVLLAIAYLLVLGFAVYTLLGAGR
ncbi:hypothetical protein G5V59_00330 [Nocardioides sp. W3-2-3]|uniref:hypothetical protein n=1 Tax=Nocardioides convexus TaxID=2712224 RepID=UPI0024187F4C|nr:hypothetical protein [Nocardioides convexus]NGZ99417.1 hypothetical protein [Nocardioides convexus]